MLPSLFAALFPAATLIAEPPLLPASGARASVGVRVESRHVRAENFSDAPRWLVFSSGGFHVTRLLAPRSSLEWASSLDCLYDVELAVLDTDGGALHASPTVPLLGALELGGEALWFGASPTCWFESDGVLQPLFDAKAETNGPAPFHVPVVRPTDRPEGDRPPPIDNKPLPPI